MIPDRRTGPHIRNMVAAWTGAISSLALLIAQWPTRIHPGFLTALLCTAAAGVILVTIIRFEPDEAATLALSGGLGAAFSALSYCLVQ